jgi:hypothetical protein
MLTLTEPVIASGSPTGKDLSAPSDLDRALVEAAKEMNVEWPEFLPVQRIKAGVAKTALRLLLLAGVFAPRLIRLRNYLGLLIKRQVDLSFHLRS